MRRLFAWLFKVSGWKVEGDFPRDIKKYVIIVAPHTSNWDFPVGLGARAQLRMSHAKYLGKDSLFKGPFGWVFYKLGGYPVDRSKSTNLVDSVAEIFEKHETFILTLAPEGTRKKVQRLKTGFWYIAEKANVPIVMVGFDYPSKTIKIDPPFHTTSIENDMPMILDFFRRMRGKIPEYGVDETTTT